MSKKYVGTAKNIAEFKINIVAENEEEALMILDNIVSNFEIFLIKDNQIIDLSVEEISNKNEKENDSHSDEYEINNCEKCEYYCPFCHSCMIDE